MSPISNSLPVNSNLSTNSSCKSNPPQHSSHLKNISLPSKSQDAEELKGLMHTGVVKNNSDSFIVYQDPVPPHSLISSTSLLQMSTPKPDSNKSFDKISTAESPPINPKKKNTISSEAPSSSHLPLLSATNFNTRATQTHTKSNKSTPLSQKLASLYPLDRADRRFWDKENIDPVLGTYLNDSTRGTRSQTRQALQGKGNTTQPSSQKSLCKGGNASQRLSRLEKRSVKQIYKDKSVPQSPQKRNSSTPLLRDVTDSMVSRKDTGKYTKIHSEVVISKPSPSEKSSLSASSNDSSPQQSDADNVHEISEEISVALKDTVAIKDEKVLSSQLKGKDTKPKHQEEFKPVQKQKKSSSQGAPPCRKIR